MKENLMFYNAYENFYEMTAHSKAFAEYCKAAFGEDLSQDGFSDINQIEMILNYFPKRSDLTVLDVGCGNGKLLKYLRSRIGCKIHGFDYSENAIRTAISLNDKDAEFKVGIIGETEYPPRSFDAVISMDSIYFADNMNKFVGQVNNWLKNNGVFIVGYQEGDVMPKTENADTAVIAQAFRENNMGYVSIDITEDTYNLLLKKRRTILGFKNEFDAEGISEWFDVVLNQTNCVEASFEEYRKNNARYIFISC